MSIVNETLNELLENPKQTIICFNKIDLVSVQILNEQKNYWRNLEHKIVFISAQKNMQIKDLKTSLFQLVQDLHYTRFPFNKTTINY